MSPEIVRLLTLDRLVVLRMLGGEPDGWEVPPGDPAPTGADYLTQIRSLLGEPEGTSPSVVDNSHQIVIGPNAVAHYQRQGILTGRVYASALTNSDSTLSGTWRERWIISPGHLDDWMTGGLFIKHLGKYDASDVELSEEAAQKAFLDELSDHRGGWQLTVDFRYLEPPGLAVVDALGEVKPEHAHMFEVKLKRGTAAAQPHGKMLRHRIAVGASATLVVDHWLLDEGYAPTQDGTHILLTPMPSAPDLKAFLQSTASAPYKWYVQTSGVLQPI